MKKIGVILTITVVFLLIACLFVGCNKPSSKNDGILDNVQLGDIGGGSGENGESGVSGGSVTVDKETKTITVNIPYSASTLSATALNFGDGVSYKVYEDEAMTKEVSGELALSVGTQTYYIKAWTTDESKSETFKLVVNREENKEDGNKQPTFPTRGEVTPSEITKAQILELILPIVSKMDKELESNYAEGIASFMEGEDFDLVAMLRKSGVTYEQAKSILAAAGDNLDKTMSFVCKVLDFDMEGIMTAVTDSATLESVFATVKAVLNNVKVEQGQEFMKAFYGDDSNGSVYISYNRGGKTVSIEKFKELFPSSVSEHLEKALSSVSYTDLVVKAADGDDVYYAETAIIGGIKNICDFDKEKMADIAKIAFKFMQAEDFDALLSGKGDVSYKDMVAAVNSVGKLLNSFLDGVGDYGKLEEALSSALFNIFNAMEFLVEEEPSFEGAFGAIEFVADILEGITDEVVSRIFLDYDAFCKAEEGKESEKFGCLLADAATFIKPYYDKLADSSLTLAKNICASFDLKIDTEAVKTLMAKATAKSAAEMSVDELNELTKIMGTVWTFTKAGDAERVSNSRMPMIQVGADDKAVEKLIANSLMNFMADEWIYLRSCTLVSCNTEKAGFVDMTVENKGQKYILKAYVYENTDNMEFGFDNYNYRATSFEKGTVTEEKILQNLLEGYVFYGHRVISEIIIDGKYIIMPEVDVDWDNVTVIGFTPDVCGEHGCMVRIPTDLGDVYIPVVYFVSDPENPVLTGMSFDCESRLLEGTELEVTANPIYDYNTNGEKITLSKENISGFDKTAVGRQNVTFTYTMNGQTFTGKRNIEVMSLEEAREIKSFYINSYPHTWFTLGEEVSESQYFSGTIYFAFGSESFNNLAECQEILTKYGYVVEHDIDTSTTGENKQYKIWIAEKTDGTKVKTETGSYSVLKVEISYFYIDSIKLTVGDDVEAASLTGQFNADNQTVYFFSLGELREKMTKFGYGVEHNIVATEEIDNSHYEIFIIDGAEKREGFSGWYSVSAAQNIDPVETKTTAELQNDYRQIGGNFIFGMESSDGAGVTIMYDNGDVYLEMVTAVEPVNRIWMIDDDDVVYSIVISKGSSEVTKITDGDTDEYAKGVLNEVMELIPNDAVWNEDDGGLLFTVYVTQYDDATFTFGYNYSVAEFLASLYPIPDEYQNYKDIAVEVE